MKLIMANVPLVLLFTLLFFQTYADICGNFPETTQNIETVYGATTIVPCSITRSCALQYPKVYLHTDACIWVQEVSYFTITNGDTYALTPDNSNPVYEFLSLVNSSSCSLIIQPVTKLNRNNCKPTYEFSFSSTKQMNGILVSRTIHFDIKEPRRPDSVKIVLTDTMQEQNSGLVIALNSSLKLSCVLENAFPTVTNVTYTWTIPNEVSRLTSSADLVIPLTKRTHSGAFMCGAEYSGFDTDWSRSSSSLLVTVQYVDVTTNVDRTSSEITVKITVDSSLSVTDVFLSQTGSRLNFNYDFTNNQYVFTLPQDFTFENMTCVVVTNAITRTVPLYLYADPPATKIISAASTELFLVVIGILALISVIIIVVVIFLRKRGKCGDPEEKPAANPNGSQESGPAYASYNVVPPISPSEKDPEKDRKFFRDKINEDDFQIHKEFQSDEQNFDVPPEEDHSSISRPTERYPITGNPSKNARFPEEHVYTPYNAQQNNNYPTRSGEKPIRESMF